MKISQVPLSEAVGHILLHNQVGKNGRKLLRKGRRLTPEDIEALESLGREQVYVAILADDDVDEDEAARRLGNLLETPGIATSSATTGRVNLIASASGLFKVNVDALLAFNDCPGVTLGTIPTNTVVEPKKMLGTVKIIPYSIPGEALEQAEAIARSDEGEPLVQVKPFVAKKSILLLTGSQAARQKVINGFTAPLQERLAAYGVEMIPGPYLPEDETEISQALQEALDSGAEMILIAGETSIMDADDITPRAIKAIGGQVELHGAPVEPGNLLLLAYHQNTPIVGAPGCARSKSYNIVDMVLPRLAAGEHLTRRDIIALGHGGLLKH